MRTKFSFLLCACICVFACWPLMCIWWNMSADFRVITTSVVDVHPISAVANSALCVICTNCGVLFVRFARFAALTLGLSTVPHFKLSIHSTFYFSVSRRVVQMCTQLVWTAPTLFSFDSLQWFVVDQFDGTMLLFELEQGLEISFKWPCHK